MTALMISTSGTTEDVPSRPTVISRDDVPLSFTYEGDKAVEGSSYRLAPTRRSRRSAPLSAAERRLMAEGYAEQAAEAYEFAEASLAAGIESLPDE